MNAGKLKKLFFSNLYLSSFTFGGGYVIITLMKSKFVDELHWIKEEEILDLTALSQSAPGPVAVNAAIVLGYKIEGIPGAVCAMLGAIIPPFIILTVISFFYTAFKTNFYIQALLTGMKAGIGAVIMSVVYDMAIGILQKKDLLRTAMMIFAFAANYIYKVNVIYIILMAAAIGLVRGIISKREGARE